MANKNVSITHPMKPNLYTIYLKVLTLIPSVGIYSNHETPHQTDTRKPFNFDTTPRHHHATPNQPHALYCVHILVRHTENLIPDAGLSPFFSPAKKTRRRCSRAAQTSLALSCAREREWKKKERKRARIRHAKSTSVLSCSVGRVSDVNRDSARAHMACKVFVRSWRCERRRVFSAGAVWGFCMYVCEERRLKRRWVDRMDECALLKARKMILYGGDFIRIGLES